MDRDRFDNVDGGTEQESQCMRKGFVSIRAEGTGADQTQLLQTGLQTVPCHIPTHLLKASTVQSMWKDALPWHGSALW